MDIKWFKVSYSWYVLLIEGSEKVESLYKKWEYRWLL